MRKLFLCTLLIVMGVYLYMNNNCAIKELTELQMMNIEALTSDIEGESGEYKECFTGSISNGIHLTVPGLFCGDCEYHRVLVNTDGKCRLFK